MTTPRIYRTEAIVLRHARYGEAGRLLTIFTPHLGKLRVVAKGVLRPTSHMAGHLEVLTRATLLIAHSRSFDIVTQAQTLDSNIVLRDDLQRMSRALYVAELVDRLSEEHHENYLAYQQFLQALQWLTTAEDLDVPIRFFELRLLDLSGYRPELYVCLQCKQTLQEEPNGFSGAAGGTLCPRCALGDAEARTVSVAAQKVLRLLLSGDLARAQRLRLTAAVSRELDAHMRHYLPHLTERDLRSAAFLDAVRATQPADG